MKALTEDRLRAILAWLVIALLVAPVGGAVLLGVFDGDSPCILCWAQRTSMILIALVGLFVVRYGPKPRYLGLVLLLGLSGLWMGQRHASLHLARDVGQGFAAPIFGIHTFTWAWFIHFVVLLVVGVLLLFLRRIAPEEGTRDPGSAGRFAMLLFLVVVGANALQAFASTGPPPFMGQADPVRLSLNPAHWVWSLDEARGGWRVSLRGSWGVPDPLAEAAAVDASPAAGPLTDLPALDVAPWTRLDAPAGGAWSGFARDAASGHYLAVTTEHEVVLFDSTLTSVLHRVVIDPAFSVDLSPFAGATFLGADTLGVLSTNKSYALLTPDPGTDPDLMWRRFLESDGGVTELRRSRLQTVRAHQMYALSMAWDDHAREVVTVAVPNPFQRRLVVSRFDGGDWQLSSEFEPRLAAGLALREGASLGDYVVTGAAAADGRLYALSAAYSTLLVIDLDGREVVAAYTLPGVEQPVGLAVRGSELLVLQADGGVGVVEGARAPAAEAEAPVGP